MEWYIRLAETGFIPDFLIRIGIRKLLYNHLRELQKMNVQQEGEYLMELVKKFSRGPVAVSADKANQQHYEVPPDFFRSFLGKHMKYSGAYFPPASAGGRPEASLDKAETVMLELTAKRADIKEDQHILDLGCGWGAMSLFLAEKYPDVNITFVSGSRDQIDFIRKETDKRGLSNLTGIVSDINDFDPEDHFDRILSVEMFEHMKNYRELMKRISSWLNPEGKLFVHIFSHRRYCYEYPETGSWMARTFFTGGTMPADNLLLYFQEHLVLENHWRVSGRHYGRTLRAWLKRYDKNRGSLLPILRGTYGAGQEKRWFIYWRLFLMACEETFSLKNGDEYMVSHYLFDKREP